MIKKWYFGSLLSAIVLLIVMQNQTVVPNQEIVLEFSNKDVNSSEAQKTIALLKRQLESLGVQNTKIVKQTEEGKLTITYFSDNDIAFVKKALTSDTKEIIDLVVTTNSTRGNELPSDETSSDYELQVRELQEATDQPSDFVISTVSNGKAKKNRVVKFSSVVTTFTTSANDYEMVGANALNTNATIYIDQIRSKIPEVRAGPLS